LREHRPSRRGGCVSAVARRVSALVAASVATVGVRAATARALRRGLAQVRTRADPVDDGWGDTVGVRRCRNSTMRNPTWEIITKPSGRVAESRCVWYSPAGLERRHWLGQREAGREMNWHLRRPVGRRSVRGAVGLMAIGKSVSESAAKRKKILGQGKLQTPNP
jgi:hypothetical protein